MQGITCHAQTHCCGQQLVIVRHRGAKSQTLTAILPSTLPLILLITHDGRFGWRMWLCSTSVTLPHFLKCHSWRMTYTPWFLTSGLC